MIDIDFETKSYADLKKVGAWAYSEHPTTDVICIRWGIDDGPIEEWWPGMNEDDSIMPEDLYMAIMTGHRITAHHAAFEISIWMNVMVKKYSWMHISLHRWDDTMAAACYYSMPAALDRLAYALGFEGKDPEGTRLISKYSKLHLKTAKTEIPDEDLFKFVGYCGKDVEIEQSVGDYLGDLPDREKPVWNLDKKINMRGLHLDIEGIRAATKIVDQRSGELTEEFIKLTGYKPTQDKKLKNIWFSEQGLTLENMQKDYLQDLLDEGDLPSGPSRTALEIRLKINKASTKKLDAMSRQRGSDNRARFQSRYHGACTGRWTGSGFGPLNLNRGFDGVDPDQLVRDIMLGDADWLDLVYGDAMDAVGKATRHWIMAEEGSKIVAGDFVSIEAIILACLAGEEWKIKAFEDGVKIYEYMADKIYDLPAGTVTKKSHPAERQDGKTGELAFGYQGNLGAWLKFDSSGRHSDERIKEICAAWREEHPAIVKFWYDMQYAALRAVRKGGLQTVREIGFEVVDEWLTMILPNGKRLWYYDPQIRLVKPPWCKPHEDADCALGTCDHDLIPQLTYMSQKTGQWKRVNTYGGKLVENACQAVSREILVSVMLAIEEEWDVELRKQGYITSEETCIILSVYDEVIVEVPEGFKSTEELEDIMVDAIPDFSKPWPVRAKAWQGERYKK